MKDLKIRFPTDDDGTLAALTFAPEDPEALRALPLELAVLLQGDDLEGDPVLSVRDLAGSRSLFRSEPLGGELFFKLKEIWDSRRGEGFRVRLGQAPDAPEVGIAQFALDFGGHLARGRAQELAGDLAAAKAEYLASASPTKDQEIARIDAKVNGSTQPPSAPPAELQDEQVVLEILRAIAADGKVDSQEIRTLQGLGAVFQLPPEKMKTLIAQVKSEARPAEGKPMVGEDVLRSLLRQAVHRGRIGPGSTQVLRRAAKALQIDPEALKAIARGE